MKTPARFVSPLTAEERENLITAFKTHSSHPVRVRAHAVLLSERRFPIDEIAEIFDVHRNTVTEWLDRWEEDRSVDDHPGRGRKPTFDDEEQKEVVKLLDEQPQSSKRVLAQIEKKTGKTISRDTLRRIAKKHRRRWKRVRRSLRKKRDEADFQAAKAESILNLIEQLPSAERIRLNQLLARNRTQEEADLAKAKPPLDKRVPCKPMKNRTLEMKWIEGHKREYAGHWVALDGDRLIAASLIHAEISAAIKADGAELPLVHRIPSPDDLPYIGI